MFKLKPFSTKNIFILFIFTLLLSCTMLQNGDNNDNDKDKDKKTLQAPVIETSNQSPIARNSYIKISFTPSDATAIYTLDGSEPTSSNGQIYSGTFLLPQINTDTFLLRVRTFKNNYNPSSITEKLFTFQSSTPDDVYLTSLSISSGTISPDFDKNIQNYTVNVPNSTSSINVTPVTTISGCNITVNDAAVVSGSASSQIPLTVGKNAVSVKVNLYDTSKTYTLNITRQSSTPSDNNYLSSLSITNASLSPSFDKTITSYNVIVPYSTADITINGSTENSMATASVKGKLLPADASLAVGLNTIDVVVTSESGVVRKYKLYVTRQENGNTDPDNNNLISLNISDVTLVPVFDKSVTSYTATVNNSIENGTVTAVTESSVASVKINGNTSPAIVPYSVGDNTVTISVVSANNSTKNYTVTIKRLTSGVITDETSLSSLSISSGTLSPAFARFTGEYTTTVPYATTSLTITAAPYNSKSTVSIDSYNSPYTKTLTVGQNTVDIIVKSTAGNTGIYTLVITRQENSGELSDNAALKSLTISDASLSPAFSGTTYIYDCGSVENSISSVTVTATPDDSKINNITINGVTASGTTSRTGTVSLAVGSNEILVVVTPEDVTKSKKTYKATITRKTGAVKGKIIVHAYNYSTIHYWNSVETNATKLYANTTWPGLPLTDESASQGENWKGKTFEGTTSISLIFNNNGAGQTENLSRTEGEWWYMNSTWTDYNPVKPVTPVITSSLAEGTYPYNQNVTLKSSNATGDIIYYTINGSTPTTSSSVYSVPIQITTGTVSIKAFGYNAKASPQSGNVSTFTYKIDPSADLEKPTITCSASSLSSENPITASFTITDNKSATTYAYYTTDGSTPSASSTLYKSGDASTGMIGNNITFSKSTLVKFFLIDTAGNTNTAEFYFRIGKVTTTRFDPRQESIYFLLTARWFDGDKSNTIGDEWCSYTKESAANFSGPEDVTWRGDFKGLVEKMDYIKALGFSTIWITPIVQNRGPLAYHGYHGWDFTKEDARLVSDGYGFQRVIDEAHKRDMKICLDIVLQHSGRFGVKDHSEIKYMTDPAQYTYPDEWSGWSWNETKYKNGQSQSYPNGWVYDGLTSPGTKNGVAIPANQRIPDTRPFTSADIAAYPQLTSKAANGFYAFQWPTTESYVKTVDNWPGKDLSYAEYLSRPSQWHRAYMNGFNDSGMFDKYPECTLRTIHEDCPELNTESTEVQQYMLNAYYRYIDMGVDMFRVDTLMHIDKETVNKMYWPQLLARAKERAATRGGSDFFIFGEVGNFVNNFSDKPAELRQPHYTWDATVTGSSGNSTNHLLNGNNYRTPDYSHKAPSSSAPYHVSVIDILASNGFCDGVGNAYGRTAGNDYAYNDATYLPWYTDSHDYGPNKSSTRWSGDFAAAWSMMFTYRGIPIVYYGSEIRFAAGKPNDWPGSTKNSLDGTGRAYYGPHLEGSVTASDFGVYTASGTVSSTLSAELSKHLIALNKIRRSVPALQMGQYSTEGHSGGWCGYKRRYVGTNTVTNEAIDSYALVGVGSGTHTWTGVLSGDYVNILTGATVTASGGSISASALGSTDAALVVLVKKDLTTAPPAKIVQDSPFLR